MSTDPTPEEISFAIADAPAAAIDRLCQVLDQHLARIHDDLQAVADRIGDLEQRQLRLVD